MGWGEKNPVTLQCFSLQKHLLDKRTFEGTKTFHVRVSIAAFYVKLQDTFYFICNLNVKLFRSCCRFFSPQFIISLRYENEVEVKIQGSH